MRTPLTRALVVAFLIAVVQAAPYAATATTGGTVSRIKTTGKLTLGYRTDARPFSYTDASGNPAGYSIELCRAIADETKRELGLPALRIEWKPVAVDSRFASLRNGDIDLVCGADSVTLGRRADVSFSIPIFPGGIGALVRADAPARLREVLSGRGPTFRPVWRAAATQLLQSRDFSVVRGTTAATWLAERMKDLDIVAAVAPVGRYGEGVQRLLDRRSDVFFGDRAILLDAARREAGGRQLLVVDRYFTYEPIALALAAGDEEFRLLVDRALSRLYRSGEIGNLYAQSFGEPDDTALAFFRWNGLPE